MILTDMKRNERNVAQFMQQYNNLDFKSIIHHNTNFNNVDNFRLFILPSNIATTKELYKQFEIDIKNQVVYLIKPLAENMYGIMRFIKLPKLNKMLSQIASNLWDRYDVYKHTFVFVADKKSFSSISYREKTSSKMCREWTSNIPSMLRHTELDIHYRPNLHYNRYYTDKSMYNVGAYRYNLLRNRVFKDSNVKSKLERIRNIEKLLKPIYEDIQYSNIGSIRKADIWVFSEFTHIFRTILNVSSSVSLPCDSITDENIKQAVKSTSKRLTYSIGKIRGHIKYILNQQSDITQKYGELFEQALEM